MAIAAAITSGVSILQGIQSLSGGAGDAPRLAANQAAFDLAIQGNDNALQYLQARSVKDVIQNVPGYGSIGGWATDTARADAAAKYQQALQVRKVDAVAQNAGAQVQTIAQKTGNTIVPLTQAELLRYGAILLVLVVVAFVALRKRRA